MTPTDPLGRLLPRYEISAQRFEIDWNVKPGKRKPDQPETVDRAVIVDLSLGGALIQAGRDSEHVVNDTVTVRFGGVDGQVIIRHRQEAEDAVLYGVEWDVSIDALELIKTAVGFVRMSGELPPQWEEAQSPALDVQPPRLATDFLRDRLLPRYSLANQQPRIGWDVKLVNPVLRRREARKEAIVLDLSLGGALIEVSAPDTHEADDVVIVRLGGVDDQVVIRHRQESGDAVLYGLEWGGSYEFSQAVAKAVQMARGDSEDKLRTRWESGRD